MLLPTLLVAAFALAKHKGYSLSLYARLFLFALVMSLTLSRGGIIGGLAGLLIAAVLLYRSISLMSVALTVGTVALGAIVAIGAIYAATALSHHSTTKGDTAVKRYVSQSTNLVATSGSSDSDRVVDKRLATQAFRARPLLGYGIGSFGTYAKRTDPKFYPASGNSPTVNDEYLEVLAETGILGAVALLGLVLTLAWRAVTALRQPLAATNRTWLAALIATAIAYGIQYYAFSTLYIPHIWVAVGLLLALTAPTSTSPRHAKKAATVSS
jgi:O-antigen ligase